MFHNDRESFTLKAQVNKMILSFPDIYRRWKKKNIEHQLNWSIKAYTYTFVQLSR